jgi:hypothetical protein
MKFPGSSLNCTLTPTLCHQAIVQTEFMLDLGRDFLIIIFMCVFGLSLATCLYHQFLVPYLRKSFDVPTLQNLFLYALNFLSCTTVLVLEVSFYDRVFFDDVVATRDKTAIVCCFTGGCLSFATYAVELAFRPRMRGYLVVHHVLTNFSLFLGVAFAIDYLLDGYFLPAFRIGVLMGLHINTEQCIFLSMFLRVFAKNSQSEPTKKRLFWWSAMLMLGGVFQTLVIKMGASIVTAVIILRDAFLTEGFFDRASGATKLFSFYILIAVIMLGGVQLYAAYIYFVIYRSTMKNYVQTGKLSQTAADGEGASPLGTDPGSPVRDPFGLLSPSSFSAGSFTGSSIWDPASPSAARAVMVTHGTEMILPPSIGTSGRESAAETCDAVSEGGECSAGPASEDISPNRSMTSEPDPRSGTASFVAMKRKLSLTSSLWSGKRLDPDS